MTISAPIGISPVAQLRPGARLVIDTRPVELATPATIALPAQQRAMGDDGPEDQRRFEFLHTHDRELIVRCARSLMLNIVPAVARPGAEEGRRAA